MEKSISTLDRTIQTPFLISYANVRDIDEEWNLIKWNKEHKEIDCHRLYFRSDNGDAKVTLTLIDGKIELLPNKIYFIPAYSVLQSEIKGTMHKYYIHFRTDSPLLNLYRFFSNKFSVDAPAFTEMLFSTIVENYTKNSPDALMQVQGAMSLLLANFLKGLETQNRNLTRFLPIIEFIDEHYAENISITQLARLLSVSTKHFAKTFKKTFLISPHQYVINKRITESQKLLVETDLSVKEIAYTVGFDNENYFSELFKNKIGVSALNFRKRAITQHRPSIL